MSTRGGLCFALNVFMKSLLEALGYNVFFITGAIHNHLENHVLTVARDVTRNGSQHLVDVGSGIPTPLPIPLDFVDESPVYSSSFIQYRYKCESGKVVQHVKRNIKYVQPTAKQERENDWRPFCAMDLVPKDDSSIRDLMHNVCTDVESKRTVFHKTLRVVAAASALELREVVLRDKSFFVEDELHCLVETKLASSDEFLLRVGEHFPQLEDLAKLALKNITL